jgi:hypothetical protein
MFASSTTAAKIPAKTEARMFRPAFQATSPAANAAMSSSHSLTSRYWSGCSAM